MNINHVQLLGNATKDPETKKMPSGQELTRFTVATNYSWIDAKSKEKRESSDFHKIVAWGKLGDLIKKFVHKGEKVLIEGRLVNRQWEVKGVKHYQTEVVATNFIMLSSKKSVASGTVLVEEPSLEEIEED
jgi:single-strand DNA-binding protein